ncbi:zinc finger protein 805-like [Pieris brassicae]|uniref:zinc finger protein 805-like n=1 Tax=Pieris brassicae TaxID=7116 RepID=UPI001E661698|nr:zinc finger protein 805-like [Pieris brassicae]
MDLNKDTEVKEQQSSNLQAVKIDESNDFGDNISLKQQLKLEPEQSSFDTNIYKKYFLRETKLKPDAYIEDDKINSKRNTSKKDTIMKNTLEDLYICDICDFTTSSEIGMTSHRNSHIKITNKYECNICKQEFSTNTLLKNHKDKHEDETFLCKKCKLAFSNHRAYLTHLINHMTKPPYTCFECDYEFRKRVSLKAHIKSHFLDVEVQCAICKKKIEKRSLNNHIQTYHSATECIECHKLVSKNNIDYHMAVHTGLKPVQCLYCGKGFITTSQRLKHSRVHTDYRPYKCEICERAFPQNIELQKHIFSKHSSHRYECDTCGKRYKHKNSLAMHIRIHSNYKPFRCPKCPKVFTVLPSLKCHFYASHIKENKFHCETCGIKFKTIQGLRRHKLAKAHQRMEYKSRMEK